MAATTNAVATDLLVLSRGQLRPRVTAQSIGDLGRTSTGALVIETRTDDPTTPEEGQLWLRTDL